MGITRSLSVAVVALTVAAGIVPVTAGPTTASAAVLQERSAAAPTVRFTIGTHNVWRGAARFTDLADVIGWQEVNEPKDRAKLRRSLPGYDHYVPRNRPAAAAVPISWRRSRFTLVNAGTVRTHGGEAKVTPSRHVNWVLLRSTGTGKRFVFVNTHFISGAFSGHPERQARWYRHANVLRAVVRQLEAKGHPVFVVGDFNRHRRVTMTGLRGIPMDGTRAIPIDQLYAHQARTSIVRRLATHGSDHHAYRAPVVIAAR